MRLSIGDRVVLKKDIVSFSKGTKGLVVDDYSSGIMVAWETEERPMPDKSCTEIATMFAIDPRCPFRDGFSNDEIEEFLERMGLD